MYWHRLKCKQTSAGFEIGSSCQFCTAITVTSQTLPLNLTVYELKWIQYVKPCIRNIQRYAQKIQRKHAEQVYISMFCALICILVNRFMCKIRDGWPILSNNANEKRSFDCLNDFNVISIRLGLFHAYSFGNCTLSTTILAVLCSFVSYISWKRSQRILITF